MTAPAFAQKRPYLDVTDATQAIAFMIDRDIFEGDLYNAVTCHSTVRDVIKIIRKEIPALKVQRVNSKAMNDYSYEVSTNKLRSLGFRFKGSLKKGVRDTIRLLYSSSLVSGSR